MAFLPAVAVPLVAQARGDITSLRALFFLPAATHTGWLSLLLPSLRPKAKSGAQTKSPLLSLSPAPIVVHGPSSG